MLHLHVYGALQKQSSFDALQPGIKVVFKSFWLYVMNLRKHYKKVQWNENNVS